MANRRLWIVLADGENARFVRVDEDNVLRTEVAFSSASPRYARELVSDKPGRNRLGAKIPQVDLQALEKSRFAQFVAEQLSQYRYQFQKLILVGPNPIISQMRRSLDTSSASCLMGTMLKDLVNVPDHQLHPYFSHWVGPRKRELPPNPT